jgi:hypothetical protein
VRKWVERERERMINIFMPWNPRWAFLLFIFLDE